ncbi:DNA helicase [Tanacetum coccineum]
MTISFTIWDDVASKFGMEAYGLMEKPVVIAASSCWVTSKYGGLQLTATTATHYSLNPNIPEVDNILNMPAFNIVFGDLLWLRAAKATLE